MGYCSNVAYLMYIYLVGILTIAICAQYKFFKDIKRTIIVGVELILGLSVVTIMVTLFPDMKTIFWGQIESKAILPNVSLDSSVDKIMDEISINIIGSHDDIESIESRLPKERMAFG